MKLESKFNLEQEVYFMKDNNIHCGIISAIEIFYVGTNQNRISYNAKKKWGAVTWLDYTNLREEELYLNKEDLLKTL